MRPSPQHLDRLAIAMVRSRHADLDQQGEPASHALTPEQARAYLHARTALSPMRGVAPRVSPGTSAPAMG